MNPSNPIVIDERTARLLDRAARSDTMNVRELVELAGGDAESFRAFIAEIGYMNHPDAVHILQSLERETERSSRTETADSENILFNDAEQALLDLDKILGPGRISARDSVRELIQLTITRTRRLILYLGAGCSKSVRVRTGLGEAEHRGLSWKGLLQALYERTMSPEQRWAFLGSLAKRAECGTPDERGSEIDCLLRSFDKLQLAWFLTSQFPDRAARDSAISALCEPPSNAERESPLYESLLAIPFDDIITTNYDTNIKYFADKKRISLYEVVDSRALAGAAQSDAEHRVYYLHGKAGSSRLVFDRFDYAGLLAEHDGILDYVCHLMRDSHVVYVGFGLEDPTFNLMEMRLQTLYGTYRPDSFAFIPQATEAERDHWRQRHLSIVDYEKHGSLPTVFHAVNTVRRFVKWAEPQRPKRVSPNDDRTSKYMEKALRCYVAGDFEQSMVLSRAALASTLFWEHSSQSDGTGAVVLPFERAARLCDIRIRLALNHYKLRWGLSRDEDETDHAHLMRVNMDGAQEIITRLSRSSKGRDDDMKSVVLTALRNSHDILKSRIDYHTGKFVEAQERYNRVASDETRELANASPFTPDARAPFTPEARAFWKLKLLEGYYYARCQASRITYQLAPSAGRESGSTGAARRHEAEALSTLAEELKGAAEAEIQRCRETCGKRAEWEYFAESLGTIVQIARWTAGRHMVGICLDVIPTRSERTKQVVDDLSRGISLLDPDLRRKPKQGRVPSPRWCALRLRYLCRGYALRWVVQQTLHDDSKDTGESDLDLSRAYEALQEAMQSTTAPGLGRQRMVTLLEAARLNILTIFGIRLREAHHPSFPRLSPLSFGAGLHYLDNAFLEMERTKNAGAAGETTVDVTVEPTSWAQLLGLRLASYFALVAGGLKEGEIEQIKSHLLREFMGLKVNGMADRVVKEHQRFADRLGDSDALNIRITTYRKHLNEIREELNGTSPGTEHCPR